MEKEAKHRTIFSRFKLKLSFNIILIILILIGLLFLITNYIFLFTKFHIGDFVYNTEDSLKVGKIEGINVLTGNYLVKWNSGEYSNEFFWDIGSLSELEGYDISTLGLKTSSKNANVYSNFKKEDNFKDYVLSSSDSSDKFVVYSQNYGFNYTSELNCKPSYSCSDWGFCKAEYNLDDLLNNNAVFGIQYRLCVDDNGCLPNLLDSQRCVLSTDIITRQKVWCNKTFLEVLDLNGTVLARLDKGLNSNTDSTKMQDYLDININLLTNGYCYYCFNNKKDFDETGRDCGGSCSPCGQTKK